MKKFSPILLVGVVLLFAACESADQTPVPVPTVSVDCPAPTCNASMGGNPLTVWLSRSGCWNAFEVPAVGSTTASCDSSGCTGTISTWGQSSDPNIPVNEVLSGSYSVCAYIDLDGLANGSDITDTGDPEHISSTTINDSTTSLFIDFGWAIK